MITLLNLILQWIRLLHIFGHSLDYKHYMSAKVPGLTTMITDGMILSTTNLSPGTVDAACLELDRQLADWTRPKCALADSAGKTADAICICLRGLACAVTRALT